MSRDRDAGATMMEYALVVGAVALVVVGATAIFGEAVAQLFNDFAGLF